MRAAEAQLHAATAAVEVAIANMLPQITPWRCHWQCRDPDQSDLRGSTEFWTLGASLSQTLFARVGRSITASAQLEPGSTLPAAQYRAAVLTAFQNVADALRALTTDGDAVRAQERAYTAATASLAIVRQQFDLGAVSYVALLNAQQTYQQAIIGRAQALTNRYADTAALYQALGGAAPPRSPSTPSEVTLN